MYGTQIPYQWLMASNTHTLSSGYDIVTLILSFKTANRRHPTKDKRGKISIYLTVYHIFPFW